MRLLLVSAVAMVNGDGKILLAQRPEGKALAGLWEFPGGKVEAGESPEMALIRELHEEIGVTVRAENLVSFAFASHRYENFHLLMPLYLCHEWSGPIMAREGQSLAWVEPERLADYPAPAADLPLFEELKRRMKHEQAGRQA